MPGGYRPAAPEQGYGGGSDSTAKPLAIIQVTEGREPGWSPPESPTRFYGAWAGPRGAGKMFTLRPGVPGSACPELLDPQVELRILADCWRTGTSGLLSHRITE